MIFNIHHSTSVIHSYLFFIHYSAAFTVILLAISRYDTPSPYMLTAELIPLIPFLTIRCSEFICSCQSMSRLSWSYQLNFHCINSMHILFNYSEHGCRLLQYISQTLFQNVQSDFFIKSHTTTLYSIKFSWYKYSFIHSQTFTLA